MPEADRCVIMMYQLMTEIAELKAVVGLYGQTLPEGEEGGGGRVGRRVDTQDVKRQADK